MRIWAIIKKELITYFSSLLIYVLGAAFLFIAGFLFTTLVVGYRLAEFRYITSNLSVLLLFITPFFTMRLLAEEKRLGTIEMLFTSPVSDTGIALGKYLAAVIVYAVILFISLYMFVILKIYSPDLDVGPIITGYIGLLLMGSTCLAIGLFASAIASHQIIAAAVAFLFLLLFWLVDLAGRIAGGSLGSFFQNLSMFIHIQNFAKGIFDIKDLIYFLSVIFFFLFTTVRIIEARTWR